MSKNIIGTNRKINLNIENDIKNLDDHIEAKIVKLDGRMRYVKYKFEDVIYNFKNYSISIIVLATLLTLIEAFTNMINVETIVPINLKHFVKFIPLVLSSIVSLLAAIIKFNKYEEKIENITRATENGIVILAELKNVKEELYFCKDEATLIAITNKYKKDVYKNYLESNINIEKQLVNSDFVKYLKVDTNTNIREKKIEFNKNKKLNNIGKKFSTHRNITFTHTNSNDALRMAKSSQISTAQRMGRPTLPNRILGRRTRHHRAEPDHVPTIEEEMEQGYMRAPVTPCPLSNTVSPGNIAVNITEMTPELKATLSIQKMWRDKQMNKNF